MFGLALNSLAISFWSAACLAGSLPNWITSGPTSDVNSYFSVCSGDALDANEAEALAQSSCLANAAKLSGVTIQLHAKTVESITGNDSSEVSEIKPITRLIQCTWNNRFLEVQGTGFRVWLQCAVSRKSVDEAKNKLHETDAVDISEKEKSLPKYKRAIVTVTCLPPADLLIIGGDRGERVVNASANPTNVELKEGDKFITAKKRGYGDKKLELDNWNQGDSVNLNFRLQRGI